MGHDRVTGSRLVHQALVYDSPADFVATAAPFLREGMERGDTLFAATAPANVEALRDELGSDADHVDLNDTETWKPRPADRLAAVQRMVDAVPAGNELRALGEPIWPDSEAVRREWARYEAVINLVLADAPLRFICLYDGARLPAEAIDHGCCTHPEVLEAGRPLPSPRFVEPERYVARLERPQAVAGGDLSEICFDGDHHALRTALAEMAGQTGLRDERVEALVLAANEVSANASVHGRPPIKVRAGTADGEFLCEVSDSGPGLSDPLAGWTIPDRAEPGGWGLPLSRRLCDALDIVPGDDGTRVYLHVALDDGSH